MAAYPEVDTKKEISHGWTQVGGPVPVALCTAAALGAKTRLLSRWGNDSDGRYIKNTLSKRDIDSDCTKSADDWQSGSAQVWLSQLEGSRTIAFSRGTFPPLTAEDVTDVLLDGCEILHLDGWASDAAIPAAMKMKEQGGTVVLDAGSVKPGLDQLLPHVDVLIASKLFRDAFQTTPSQNNAARQTVDGICEPETVQTTLQKSTTERPLARLGIPTVITTNGAKGATLFNNDGTFNIKGHTVNCVDSNGAGDIFSGAVLYGMTQKWSMLKSVKFANKMAAVACTRFGNDSTGPVRNSKQSTGNG